MKRIRPYIIIFFSFFGGMYIYAQQTIVTSMFDKNIVYYNPAAVGKDEVPTANFIWRKQWVGVEGSPNNIFFLAHTPLKDPKVAMGINLEHESMGNSSSTNLFVNYAYRQTIGNGKLSLGIKFGIQNFSQNQANLRDPDPDFAFNNENLNSIIINSGFGAYYKSDIFWTSFSIPKFFGYKADEGGKYKTYFDIAQFEYFFAGGARIPYTSEIALEPSALLILSSAYKPSFQINLAASYNVNYKVGLGYRSGDALIVIIGYKLNNQFSLAYSYDIQIGKVIKQTSGSHEINLLYKFGKTVNTSNPRDF